MTNVLRQVEKKKQAIANLGLQLWSDFEEEGWDLDQAQKDWLVGFVGESYKHERVFLACLSMQAPPVCSAPPRKWRHFRTKFYLFLQISWGCTTVG